MFFFDLETHLTGPGSQFPPIVCMAHATDSQGPLLSDRADAFRYFVDRLRSDVLVGHSVAFDIGCFGTAEPELWPEIFRAYDEGRIICTEVDAKLHDIEDGCLNGFYHDSSGAHKVGYGLDDLVLRHFGQKLDKSKDTWRLRYKELDGIPIQSWPREAIDYPIGDVDWTRRLWSARMSRSPDAIRQYQHAFWLRIVQANGLRTDPVAIDRFERHTRDEMGKAATELYRAGLLRPPKGKKLEPTRNVKAVRERVAAAYTALGLPVPLSKSEKNTATDAFTCEESGDPVLIAYANYTSYSGIIARNIPELRAGVLEPIHSRFDSLKDTGRTGSSNPNVQNRNTDGLASDPPHWGDRECFVPSAPGLVFIGSDFGGLELCTLGETCYQLVGFSVLGDTIKAGKDPHLVIAAEILGRPYDWCKANKNTPLVYNARQTGKVANFGFPGGLGIGRLIFFAQKAYGVRLSVEEARALKELWFRLYPEMRHYFRIVDQLVKAGGRVEQLMSGRVRGGVGYTDGCNGFFQGLGADLAKSAGYLIAKATMIQRSSPLYGWRMVNFIHDEFILEGPEESCHEAALELGEIMQSVAPIWLPNMGSIGTEPYAARRWSKAAKQVKVNGRIVPWEESMISVQ